MVERKETRTPARSAGMVVVVCRNQTCGRDGIYWTRDCIRLLTFGVIVTGCDDVTVTTYLVFAIHHAAEFVTFLWLRSSARARGRD